MKIIEKIEVKHFRSFDWWVNQEKVQIEHIEDLNIFSGSNDSGKSNVLRAINLFFNNEVSPWVKFNIERDFSKIVEQRFEEELKQKKEKAKKRKEEAEIKWEEFNESYKKRSDTQVTIKIHFFNPTYQRWLPEKFWISKIFSSTNNFEWTYIYQWNLNKAQTTLFINSFQFEYVPAIKDRNYFNYLFEKLQIHLLQKEDKKWWNKFKSSSEDLSKILKDETKNLFDKFLVTSWVQASFSIPTTLIDFFRTLSVKTENEISLFDRWDWIQARFIPDILEEISDNPKKNIIWWFEEPENSYESKNIRKLRDDFLKKYSRNKQIFITTHTIEFLSVKRDYTEKESKIIENKKLTTTKKRDLLFSLDISESSSNVSIYRVWKKDKISLITRFDEDKKTWEDTCDDLWIVNESRIIEKLQYEISEQTKLLWESWLNQKIQEKIIKELRKDMEKWLSELNKVKEKIEEYEKPILYIEDKYDQIYKIAYLKLKDIVFNETNYEKLFKENCPFIIKRWESASAVSWLLKVNNTDLFEDKKIIWLFDFDKEWSENFYSLKKHNNWNELILWDKESWFYKKRNQHPCFYSLLLPSPKNLLTSDICSWRFENYVEVENLLSLDYIQSSSYFSEKEVIWQKYYKFTWKKDKFWKELINLDKSYFNNFEPLFSKIEELFNS